MGLRLIALTMLARCGGAPCDGLRFAIHPMPPLVPSSQDAALPAPHGRPLLPCEAAMARFQADATACAADANGFLGAAPADDGTAPGAAVWGTWQFSLARIWHERIYEHCRARPGERADAVLIPYPAAEMHMATYFGAGKAFLSLETRRAYESSVRASLVATERWRASGGADHVVVLARSAAELEATPKAPRRGQFAVDAAFWRNVTKLSHGAPLRRGPARRVYGVPYATFLHPASQSDLDAWRAHAASRDRPARSHRVRPESPFGGKTLSFLGPRHARRGKAAASGEPRRRVRGDARVPLRRMRRRVRLVLLAPGRRRRLPRVQVLPDPAGRHADAPRALRRRTQRLRARDQDGQNRGLRVVRPPGRGERPPRAGPRGHQRERAAPRVSGRRRRGPPSTKRPRPRREPRLRAVAAPRRRR